MYVYIHTDKYVHKHTHTPVARQILEVGGFFKIFKNMEENQC